MWFELVFMCDVCIYIYIYRSSAYVYVTNDVLICPKGFGAGDWQAKTNIIYPEYL